MSFPQYPHYKDSGTRWLGRVPEHWEVKRIGYYFSERREKVSDKDFPALSVTKNGIVPQLDTAAKSDDSDNRKRVGIGDFVINSRSDRKGSAGTSPLNGSVSLICTVLRPKEGVHPQFVHHLLRSELFQQEFYRNGKGIVADLWTTKYSEMRNILLAIPPFSEQIQIAAFLEQEVSRVDELVSKQQQLIDLLKEKRHAVISHAVTKGLIPNVRMKSSGIDWLGKVPAHWQPIKVKWIATMQSGHTPNKKIDEYWENGQIPWVSLNDTEYLREHDYIDDTSSSISQLGIENSSARLLPARAVVFSRDATIGLCAVTTRPMAVSQHFIAWICGNDIIPEFLLFCFRSMSQELERLATGATVKTIGMPEVRTIVSPLPPLEEQRAIVSHIVSATTALDALILEAQSAVQLLRERRAAIISYAVTGRIDVRGLVRPIAA